MCPVTLINVVLECSRLFSMILLGMLMFSFLIYLDYIYLKIQNAKVLILFVVWFCNRFEQFVDYALDVPMIFVYRKNKYIACGGMSFRVILL
jgi:hypothetical protein